MAIYLHMSNFWIHWWHATCWIQGNVPPPFWVFCATQWQDCWCEGDIRWGNEETWHVVPVKKMSEPQKITCTSVWSSKASCLCGTSYSYQSFFRGTILAEIICPRAKWISQTLHRCNAISDNCLAGMSRRNLHETLMVVSKSFLGLVCAGLERRWIPVSSIFTYIMLFALHRCEA